MLDTLTLQRVRDAKERIAPYIVRTPLLRHCPKPDLELLLKPESLQPTGAFKLRGAFNRMLQLPADTPGVVAHSSGNHAQAVARAAATLGIPAVVVMPDDANPVKRRRTEADGAEVLLVGSDSEERAQMAREIARDRGLVPVEPFDDPEIAAGQGTAALEIVEDTPDGFERFYAPIGGGGLIAGCSVVLSALRPDVEIIGVEPETGDDTRRSLAAGTRCSVDLPHTIADGLRTRSPGVLTWPVLERHVARVECVSDAELMTAMVYALRELRLVLEPSGAASLAVALREGTGRCAVLLSGGNVDGPLLVEVARRAAEA